MVWQILLHVDGNFVVAGSSHCVVKRIQFFIPYSEKPALFHRLDYISSGRNSSSASVLGPYCVTGSNHQ